MKKLRWLYPGLRVKRWLAVFVLGIGVAGVGIAMMIDGHLLGKIEAWLHTMVYFVVGTIFPNYVVGLLIALVGLGLATAALQRFISSVLEVILPPGKDDLGDIIYQKRYLEKGPHVVAIGGGTGLSVLLRGIKEYTTNITAIVSVADDGGSSGRLRSEMGILPPGDIRNCLVALADTEPLMEKLFQYRFDHGEGLAGHCFGNLFIGAMTEVAGDFEKAVRESSKVLAIRGKVLPATLDNVSICAELEDGTVVSGETRIGRIGRKIKRAFLEPATTRPLPEAIEAIKQADVIVIGPGSLFTSVLPSLLVQGVGDALRRARGVRIYVTNLFIQPGETDGFTAYDHVRTLLEHLGPGFIDYVVVNTGPLARPAAGDPSKSYGQPVLPDIIKLKSLGLKVVGAELVGPDGINHHPQKLGKVIMKIVASGMNRGWRRIAVNLDHSLSQR